MALSELKYGSLVQIVEDRDLSDRVPRADFTFFTAVIGLGSLEVNSIIQDTLTSEEKNLSIILDFPMIDIPGIFSNSKLPQEESEYADSAYAAFADAVRNSLVEKLIEAEMED